LEPKGDFGKGHITVRRHRRKRMPGPSAQLEQRKVRTQRKSQKKETSPTDAFLLMKEPKDCIPNQKKKKGRCGVEEGLQGEKKKRDKKRGEKKHNNLLMRKKKKRKSSYPSRPWGVSHAKGGVRGGRGQKILPSSIGKKEPSFVREKGRRSSTWGKERKKKVRQGKAGKFSCRLAPLEKDSLLCPSKKHAGARRERKRRKPSKEEGGEIFPFSSVEGRGGGAPPHGKSLGGQEATFLFLRRAVSSKVRRKTLEPLLGV